MDILAALMFLCPTARFRFEGGEQSYDALIWEDLYYPKPTIEELETAWKFAQAGDGSYKAKRRAAYPSVEEQLATIFDIGVEGWLARIQTIKEAIPKPEPVAE